MLQRLNILFLNDPVKVWPVSVSLLLHGIFLALVVMPRAPKMPEFLTIEMKSLPQFAAPASSGRAAPAQSADAAPRVEEPQPLVKKTDFAEPVKQPSFQAPAVHKAVGDQSAAAPSSAISSAKSTGVGVAKNTGVYAKSGPAAPSGPVEGTFGAADGPSFLHKVAPVYPRFARKTHKEGTVVLRVSLDEKGTLASVTVVEKAGYGFDEAAINAVRESRFKPAKHRGVPVACKALWKVKFALED